MIIHEQTIIASFAVEEAVAALPLLLPDAERRLRAVETVQYIAGPIAEMAPRTLEMLQRFHAVLDLPPVTDDVIDDPLEDEHPAPAVVPRPPAASGMRAAAAAKPAARRTAAAKKPVAKGKR